MVTYTRPSSTIIQLTRPTLPHFPSSLIMPDFPSPSSPEEYQRHYHLLEQARQMAEQLGKAVERHDTQRAHEATMPKRSEYEPIPGRPGEYRRKDIGGTPSRTLDDIKIGPFSLPSASMDWSGDERRQVEKLAARMKVVQMTSGGRDPLVAMLQDPEVNAHLRSGALPIEVLQRFASIAEQVRRTGGTPQQAAQQMTSMMSSGGQGNTSSSSFSPSVPTRTDRMAQLQAAQPRIAAWYDKTARKLGISVEQLAARLHGDPSRRFSDEQIAYIEGQHNQRTLWAGPGTGKTETTVGAVVEAVVNRGVNLNEFTFNAYTHSGVDELRKRFARMRDLFPQWKSDQNWQQAEKFQFRTLHGEFLSQLTRPTGPGGQSAMSRLMGGNNWELMGSGVRPGSSFEDMDAAVRASQGAAEQYLERLLTQYGVQRQHPIAKYLQSIGETTSNQGNRAQYMDRFQRGADLYAQGNKGHPDAVFWLYQQATKMRGGFALQGQTSKKIDLNDVMHLYAKAAAEKIVRGISHGVFDEVQDNSADMLRAISRATQMAQGSQVYMAGDMGQRVVGGSSRADQLIPQLFQQASTHQLTGNYRSSAWTVATFNAINMDPRMQAAGTSPMQVSMSGDMGEPPSYHTASTFRQLHQQKFGNWLDTVGVTPEQLKRNITQGQHPIAGATIPGGPSQAPLIFQMREERNMFLSTVQEELAKMVGSDKAARAMEHLMPAMTVQQARSSGFNAVSASATRVGQWDDPGFLRNLLTMASRSTGSLAFYGTSEKNDLTKRWNNRFDLDSATKTPLPHGFEAIMARTAQNMVEAQGMSYSSLPSQYQYYYDVPPPSPPPGLSLSPQQNQVSIGFAGMYGDVGGHFSPAVGDSGTGIFSVEHLDPDYDEQSRALVPGGFQGGDLAFIAFDSGRGPDFFRQGYEARLTERLLTEGPSALGMMPGGQIPQDYTGFHESFGKMLGHMDMPEYEQQKELISGNTVRVPYPEDYGQVAPSDLPSDWRTMLRTSRRAEPDPFMSDIEQAQSLMRRFLFSDGVRNTSGIHSLLTRQLTNPEIVRSAIKWIREQGPGVNQGAADMLEAVLQGYNPYQGRLSRVQRAMSYFRRTRGGPTRFEAALRPQEQALAHSSAYFQKHGPASILDQGMRSLLQQNPKGQSRERYDGGQGNPLEGELRDLLMGHAISQVVSHPFAPGTVETLIKAVNDPSNMAALSAVSRITGQSDLYKASQQFQQMLGGVFGGGGTVEEPIRNSEDIQANMSPFEQELVKSMVPIGYPIQSGFREQAQFAYSRGKFARGINTPEKGRALGLSLSQSRIAPHVTEMAAMAQRLENGGILDPSAGQFVGGKWIGVQAGVGLEQYERRLLDMHRMAASGEHKQAIMGEITRVRSLRQTLHSQGNQAMWGHTLNMVQHLAMGVGAFDNKKALDEFYQPQRGSFKGGERTLESVEGFTSAIQDASAHIQATGTLKRKHVDAILASMGHDPQNAMFTKLSGLSSTFGSPESTLSLDEMARLFPGEVNNALGQFTRVPLIEGGQYRFMGGSGAGYPRIVGGQAGMQTGMVGTLHPFDAKTPFGYSLNTPAYFKHLMFTPEERDRMNALPKPVREVYPHQPLLRLNVGGQMFPVRADQLALLKGGASLASPGGGGSSPSSLASSPSPSSLFGYSTGNIFESGAQTLVNTVNTQGAMGKGLALAMKQRFPGLFGSYLKDLQSGRLKIGQSSLYTDPASGKNILNFPTKALWKDPSKLEYIEAGLKHLAANYKQMGITSLAIPKLGTANGGLDWKDVGPLIAQHLGNLDIPVTVHVGEGDEQYAHLSSSLFPFDPTGDPERAARRARMAEIIKAGVGGGALLPGDPNGDPEQIQRIASLQGVAIRAMTAPMIPAVSPEERAAWAASQVGGGGSGSVRRWDSGIPLPLPPVHPQQLLLPAQQQAASFTVPAATPAPTTSGRRVQDITRQMTAIQRGATSNQVIDTETGEVLGEFPHSRYADALSAWPTWTTSSGERRLSYYAPPTAGNAFTPSLSDSSFWQHPEVAALLGSVNSFQKPNRQQKGGRFLKDWGGVFQGQMHYLPESLRLQYQDVLSGVASSTPDMRTPEGFLQHHIDKTQRTLDFYRSPESTHTLSLPGQADYEFRFGLSPSRDYLHLETLAQQHTLGQLMQHPEFLTSNGSPEAVKQMLRRKPAPAPVAAATSSLASSSIPSALPSPPTLPLEGDPWGGPARSLPTLELPPLSAPGAGSLLKAFGSSSSSQAPTITLDKANVVMNQPQTVQMHLPTNGSLSIVGGAGGGTGSIGIAGSHSGGAPPRPPHPNAFLDEDSGQWVGYPMRPGRGGAARGGGGYGGGRGRGGGGGGFPMRYNPRAGGYVPTRGDGEEEEGGGTGYITNTYLQLGRILARVGYEMANLSQSANQTADKAAAEGSAYRQASLSIPVAPGTTVDIYGNPLPTAAQNAQFSGAYNAAADIGHGVHTGILPTGPAGPTGTSGFFNFTDNLNQQTIANWQAKMLPMYSDTQVMQGLQQFLGANQLYWTAPATSSSMNMMGLAALSGMDPSQVISQFSGIAGMASGSMGYPTPDANKIAVTNNLAGIIQHSLRGNLSQANVAPYLSAMEQATSINGNMQGNAALFQYALNAGLTPENLPQVAQTLGNLTSVGQNPDARAQYQLAQMYGAQNLTASPQYFQFQQSQQEQAWQLQTMGIQQNLTGSPLYTGLARQMGVSLPQGKLSLSTLQIQADSADIQMEKANIASSQFSLAQNTASLQENLYQQAQQYGPIGETPAQTGRAGYFAFMNRQLAAGYNPLNADTASTWQNKGPVYGLQNEEFYAGIENQRQQLVLGRSPLMADAAFQQQMKYLNQQETFYNQDLQLRNQDRAFQETWAQKSLANEAAMLKAQQAVAKATEEMKVYDATMAKLQGDHLPQEMYYLQMIMQQTAQQMQGQGSVKGQQPSGLDLISQLVSEYKHGGSSSSRAIRQQLQGMGLSTSDISILMKIIPEAAAGGNIGGMIQQLQGLDDSALRDELTRQINASAYAGQTNTAGQANQNLQQGGTDATWLQLRDAILKSVQGNADLAKSLSGTSPMVKGIGFLTDKLSGVFQVFSSLLSLIGTIALTGGAGGAGGGGGMGGGSGGSGGGPLPALPSRGAMGGMAATSPGDPDLSLPPGLAQIHGATATGTAFLAKLLTNLATRASAKEQFDPARRHPGFVTPLVNADFHKKMTYGVHQGVDFAADQGTPLYEFVGGKVKATGFLPWGGEVDIALPGGLTERYLHLSQIGVRPGQLVKAGDRLGLTGGGTPQSGLGKWSSGPHSHVQYDHGNINAGIDPWLVWGFLGDMNLSQFYGAAPSGPTLSALQKHLIQVNSMGSLAGLSQGGIAMRPTTANLAEGGAAEAIIPLSRLQSVLSSTGGTGGAAAMSAGSGTGGGSGKPIVINKLFETLTLNVHMSSSKMTDDEKDQLMADAIDVLSAATRQALGKLQ